MAFGCSNSTTAPDAEAAKSTRDAVELSDAKPAKSTGSESVKPSVTEEGIRELINQLASQNSPPTLDPDNSFRGILKRPAEILKGRETFTQRNKNS